MFRKEIKLSEHLMLAFEPQGKSVRLIVVVDGEECACRKETYKNLKAFLALAQAHIFKGRLQLQKRDHQISLIFKKELIGMFSTTQLTAVINNLVGS